MMRLAVRTLRFRKSGFIATFVAVIFGTAIVMACGGLMETGIRSNVQPERLAAASLVVTGKQSHLRPGSEDATPLPERVGVPVELLGKIRSAEGVSSATGDYTFPAISTSVASSVAEGHNWSSASLAPYTLTAGRAPRSGEVVVPSGTVGGRAVFMIDGTPKTFTISGVASGPSVMRSSPTRTPPSSYATRTGSRTSAYKLPKAPILTPSRSAWRRSTAT